MQLRRIKRMRLDNGYLKEKEIYFSRHQKLQHRLKWYYAHNPNAKIIVKAHCLAKKLTKFHFPVNFLEMFKWMFIDFLRGKHKKFSGIYAYIGLPGEGKTLSMVAHIERVKKEHTDILVATNFNYCDEDMAICHWLDIIKFANQARAKHKFCIVAMDEIHVTFDSADWQHFPPEMLSLISFNRKYNLQFICSSQIYDRVPKKIRDICNYIVICKNVMHSDRYFKNYYYEKNSYDVEFSGKIKKADFIRDYIADDWLYSRYDTKQLVDNLTSTIKEEKEKRQEAFELLFGSRCNEDASA